MIEVKSLEKQVKSLDNIKIMRYIGFLLDCYKIERELGISNDYFNKRYKILEKELNGRGINTTRYVMRYNKIREYKDAH